MLTLPKQLAPEPYFSAYLALLQHVLVRVRHLTEHPEKTSVEQVAQICRLVDAVHNIPELLLEYGYYWTTENVRRECLEPYDLSTQTETPLGRQFQEFLVLVKNRDEKSQLQ